MDINDIFNNALPIDCNRLYKNFPENKFFNIYYILKDSKKIEIFNNISDIVHFLDIQCSFDNEMSEDNLINAIGEIRLLKHEFDNTENRLNIRYYYYLELIYSLLLKFKTSFKDIDFNINIIELHNHFVAWRIYFNEIYKLYPGLKILKSPNLFLDDIIE